MAEGFIENWKERLSIDHILLIIIIVAGAILRFYNYTHLPYSFDEFSALFRTRFDNFSDLIRLGVVASDTHPAGVQVFMFLWVKVFGESEMAVKFPFILFGLGAIIIGYKVGKLWFNSTTGLFTALFLSVLQYPITYSQFARPYSSGLFLSLLMVWFWTQVIFFPEKKKALNRVGFIITAALCAYNHHFSMLMAVLVGTTGLFFIAKKRIGSYLISCFAAIVLYTPHIPILIAQINKGGVEEWLNKPRTDFILDYFNYILHFSNVLIGLTILLIAFSFIFFTQNFRATNKFRVISFLWFTITFLVGFFYSVYVNAVLQYSVLIFVFPFLVMLVFSFYGEIRGWLKSIFAMVFMVTAIYTLIYHRKHYEVMYKSVYEEIPLTANHYNHAFRGKSISTVIFEPKKIREYYIKKYNLTDSGYYYPDTTVSFIEFRDYINHQTSDLLVFGSVLSKHMEYQQIAEERYPYMIEKKGWFKGDCYLYSRKKPEDPNYRFADSIIFTSINNFDTLTKGWSKVVLPYQLTRGVDYPENMILHFTHEYSYSPDFRAKVKAISKSRTNEVMISLDTYVPLELVNPSIICEFRLHGKRIEWRSGNVIEFTDAPHKTLKAYLALRLADFELDDPDTEMWVYFWNRNLEHIFIDNFKIEIRQGNPVIYGLFEKI